MEVTKDNLKALLVDNSDDRLELKDEQHVEYCKYKNGIGETLKKAERLQEKLDKLLSKLEN